VTCGCRKGPLCSLALCRCLIAALHIRRVSPRCARLFQPRCARLIHRRLGVRFPYPPRFPQVRPTVPASVRTTDSPAAGRSFSVGKCCAAFRLPASKLFNIHLFRIDIQLSPSKLPHEAHPEIKPEIPGRKTEISCTQPCPAGWCRQGMVIFMRFYTHSLMRLNLPFYAVYRAIFMLLDALFCAVHCSTIFRPYYIFCVVYRIIFAGQVPRFTCGAFAFSFC